MSAANMMSQRRLTVSARLTFGAAVRRSVGGVRLISTSSDSAAALGSASITSPTPPRFGFAYEQRGENCSLEDAASALARRPTLAHLT